MEDMQSPEVEEQERPRVRIEVTGSRAHSGKTSIAALIVGALQRAGFDDIQVDCAEGDIRDRVLGGVDVTRIVPLPGIDVVDANGGKSILKGDAPADGTRIWRA